MALNRAIWTAAVAIALAGSARAADPANGKEAADQIRALLEGLEGWAPPDFQQASDACVRQPPASFNMKPPAVPEEQARELRATFSLSRQAASRLCGRSAECSPSKDDIKTNECETAAKLEFLRSAFSGRSEGTICRHFLGRTFTGPGENIPEDQLARVCAEVSGFVVRRDFEGLCARGTTLARLGGGSEQYFKDCRFWFRFLKGPQACVPVPTDPREEHESPVSVLACKTVARTRDAFAAQNPKLCEGDALCLAAMKDPAGCADAAKPLTPEEVLTSDDPAVCGSSARCQQIYGNAANFRNTYRGYKQQIVAHCALEATSQVQSACRARMDALLQADAAVKKLAGAFGFDDQALKSRALMRIQELSRKAEAAASSAYAASRGQGAGPGVQAGSGGAQGGQAAPAGTNPEPGGVSMAPPVQAPRNRRRR